MEGMAATAKKLAESKYDRVGAEQPADGPLAHLAPAAHAQQAKQFAPAEEAIAEEHEPILVAEEYPADVEVEESEGEIAGREHDAGSNARSFVKLPEPVDNGKPPPWFPRAKIPQGFRFPRGLDVYFIKIRGSLTSMKHKGDRFLILWELSDGDEKLAYGRCMNDLNRAPGELAKQMIRVIDGVPTNWDGMPGVANADQLWSEIGAKGRSQLQRLYSQLHVFDREEQIDFFESCIARVRTG